MAAVVAGASPVAHPKMKDQKNAVVIGAGVVGLAIARALAKKGYGVLILESQLSIGKGISSRGSHVVHAGIYYAPGSLKAKLCVKGRVLLYQYCKRNKVPFKKTGKLIVAVDKKELSILKKLISRARKNKVRNLKLLSAEQAQKLEPSLACHGAILSADSGIVDAKSFMRRLLKDAKKNGARIFLKTKFLSAKREGQKIAVTLRGKKQEKIVCDFLINCSGLDSVRVASSVSGIKKASLPKEFFAKGHYFKFVGDSPFSRLIYPVPEKGGLGVHATLDMKKNLRFGPDVVWTKKPDYSFSSNRKKFFYKKIKKYFPAIKESDLKKMHVGIRPKLARSGEADFVIQTEEQHGVAGLVNLFGIESPGLTASLAIAKEVEKIIAKP